MHLINKDAGYLIPCDSHIGQYTVESRRCAVKRSFNERGEK